MPTMAEFSTTKLHVIWLIPIGIISCYFSILDPEWHHDGILFKPAVDVASGLSLFRETFTQYGALTTYLQAGAIYLFGKALIVLRLQAALFFILIGVFNLLILRRLIPFWLAVSSTYVWFLMAPIFLLPFLAWSSIYALFFTTVGVWFLIRSIESQTSVRRCLWFCFCSGVAMAGGFWTRQPVGIVFSTTFLFFIVNFFDLSIPKRYRLLQPFSYVLGFLVSHVLMLTWLFFDEALEDWWTQSILAAYTFAETVPNGLSVANFFYYLFPSPNHVYLGNSSDIWRLMPLFTLAATLCTVFLFFLSETRRHQSKVLLALSLAAIGSWHQYFPVPDIGHMFWAATPMIGITITSVYCLGRSVGIGRRGVAVLVILFIVFIFGPDITYRINAGISRVPVGTLYLPTLKGMIVTSPHIAAQRYEGTPESYRNEFKILTETLSRIRRLDANLSLVTFTPDAYLMTEFRSINPHKIHVWWPFLFRFYPEREEQIINFIATQRPLIEVATVKWDSHNWSDPTNSARKRFGFSDYEVLISLGYADWGSTQLLAAPELMKRYKEFYGN